MVILKALTYFVLDNPPPKNNNYGLASVTHIKGRCYSFTYFERIVIYICVYFQDFSVQEVSLKTEQQAVPTHSTQEGQHLEKLLHSVLLCR